MLLCVCVTDTGEIRWKTGWGHHWALAARYVTTLVLYTRLGV